MRERLLKSLIAHEGLRLDPYLDCCGKFWRDCACEIRGALTIGVGRNLDKVGLSREEVLYLADNDIDRAERCAAQLPGWFVELDEIRKEVVLEMLFQLGLGGVGGFRKFLQAMEKGDFETAADEMLDSKWDHQTPERCEELAAKMRSGGE